MEHLIANPTQNENTIVFPVGTTTISKDTTYATENLVFAKGAIVEVEAGVTLTIGGEITANAYQIFKLEGSTEDDNRAVVTFSKIYTVLPQWFGADDTGENDATQAFEDALRSIRQSGGSLDCVGTFLCAEVKPYAGNVNLQWYVITVPSGVRIFSSSKCMFPGKSGVGRSYALFEVSNGNANIEFDNLSFDGGAGNATASTADGLGLAVMIRVLDTDPQPAKNITIKNCTGLNFYNNFVFWQNVVEPDVLPFTVYNLVIEGNYVKNVGNGESIAGEHGRYLRIRNNYVEKTGIGVSGKPRLGIDCSGGNWDVIITDNILVNNGGGFKVEAAGSTDTEFNISDLANEVVIANNVCVGGDNTRTFACKLSGSRVVLSNNIFYGFKGTGIEISGAAGYLSGDYIMFSNNIIQHIEAVDPSETTAISSEGIPFIIRATEAGTTLQDVEYTPKTALYIRNNIISDCQAVGQIQASGVTIEGNIFKAMAGGAFEVMNNKYQMADGYPQNTFDNIIIRNNKFDKVTGYPITFLKNNQVDPATGSSHVIIEGNHCINSQGFCSIDIAQDVNVSNNQYIYSGGNENINHFAFYAVNNLVISNNLVENTSTSTQGTDISVLASNMFNVNGNITKGSEYAILTDKTVDKGLVSSNVDNGSGKGYSLDDRTTGANNI